MLPGRALNLCEISFLMNFLEEHVRSQVSMVSTAQGIFSVDARRSERREEGVGRCVRESPRNPQVGRLARRTQGPIIFIVNSLLQ